MADKHTRGLPPNFKLNIDEPVVLGDYLDEQGDVSAAKRVKDSSRGEVVSSRAPAKLGGGLPFQKSVAPVSAEASLPETKKVEFVDPPLAKPNSLHPAWKRSRRKQLNLSAEGERRFEEILEHFKEFGPQEDIRMSEIFEAIVMLAYDAKEKLDLSKLPRRGAWGSPTEKNFAVHIAEAFGKAITSLDLPQKKVGNI